MRKYMSKLGRITNINGRGEDGPIQAGTFTELTELQGFGRLEISENVRERLSTFFRDHMMPKYSFDINFKVKIIIREE